MAAAKAAPSTGSVPAPSSSRSTRLFSSAAFNMLMIFVMWAEKVDRLCSMLCSSPISARIWSKTDTSLPSPAGIISPHMAISDKSPTVFRATVLPPVLGPVMIRVSKLFPRLISVGTTFSLCIKGCRAACSSVTPSSRTVGVTAFMR